MASKPKPLGELPQGVSVTSATTDPTSPTLIPPATGATSAAGGGAATADAPDLVPGGAGAASGNAGAWHDGATIQALWSINQDRNSWVYVAGTGWVKLSPTSESAIMAMTALASHARAHNRTVSYGTDDTNGHLTQLYVF